MIAQTVDLFSTTPLPIGGRSVLGVRLNTFESWEWINASLRFLFFFFFLGFFCLDPGGGVRADATGDLLPPAYRYELLGVHIPRLCRYPAGA